MKLYGMAQSRSFRALWALEETGLEYEYVGIKLFVDPAQSEAAQNPDYLALNSQGKVPTLVDGDLVLTESIAIVNYIARKAPECGLLPNVDMVGYAHHDELIAFVLAELEQPLWSNGKHRFALPEEQRIPQMLETAKFEFAKALHTLDHLLGGNEFAIGGQFSLADLLLAHTFNWAIRFEFDVPARYVELRDRHYRRPAAVRAMAVIE
ncbi:MAG: glutathione S-transferase family protein [Proteobacteria bacterium]|nr:glutathione S-transferase family protein [Pseudomonadota bacterium]